MTFSDESLEIFDKLLRHFKCAKCVHPCEQFRVSFQMYNGTVYVHYIEKAEKSRFNVQWYGQEKFPESFGFDVNSDGTVYGPYHFTNVA
jgi:hypothetical protein